MAVINSFKLAKARAYKFIGMWEEILKRENKVPDSVVELASKYFEVATKDAEGKDISEAEQKRQQGAIDSALADAFLRAKQPKPEQLNPRTILHIVEDALAIAEEAPVDHVARFGRLLTSAFDYAIEERIGWPSAEKALQKVLVEYRIKFFPGSAPAPAATADASDSQPTIQEARIAGQIAKTPSAKKPEQQ
jgi:hypothetical protein